MQTQCWKRQKIQKSDHFSLFPLRFWGQQRLWSWWCPSCQEVACETPPVITGLPYSPEKFSLKKWEKPETSPGLRLATCQSLNARFSHVTRWTPVINCKFSGMYQATMVWQSLAKSWTILRNHHFRQSWSPIIRIWRKSAQLCVSCALDVKLTVKLILPKQKNLRSGDKVFNNSTSQKIYRFRGF